ncbi:TetR/AcrR family transcriptional regulator [Micropruina sonneratiae]|uniref:TetR/AcrR family transcriptional regulator n=1 Tax=Micropruina sonneratiae TaxID=2986940 RepID=UPI002226748B|nr:TetR/AcrR family transcriptional regulator [Micropruina sp. KQZ13P-5]MCW3157037.1 TetR/AcrR family transcriptional regulator [Micropruina sp. KQZ13P-5]
MPKIAAPTVAEHRAMIRARLIDAAEAVLRDPAGQLTAGAVTSAAGIARNSIYRYVDSVEDLRALVVDRYLPEWLNAVAEALEDAHTPGDRVVAWVRVNLEQAAATGHGWLMEAARSQSPNAEMDESVAEAHAGLRNTLADSWADLLRPHPERIPIAAGLTVAILEAGFRQLDRRHPADLVIHLGTTAARALVDALSGDS